GAGKGGLVSVTQSGTIRVTGEGSTGIFAQSDGPDGGEQILVDINGVVAGGSGENSNAVWIAGGHDNVLNVNEGGELRDGNDESSAAVRYYAGAANAAATPLT